jgi:hypothetical protein
VAASWTRAILVLVLALSALPTIPALSADFVHDFNGAAQDRLLLGAKDDLARADVQTIEMQVVPAVPKAGQAATDLSAILIEVSQTGQRLGILRSKDGATLRIIDQDLNEHDVTIAGRDFASLPFHLALLLGGTSTELWVDGVQQASLSTVFKDTSTAGQPAPITVGIGDGSFLGSIGNVRIWSRLLDGPQLAASAKETKRWYVPTLPLDLLSAAQDKTGMLARVPSLVTGAWVVGDSSAVGPVKDALQGVEAGRHGIYVMEPFLGLAPSGDDFLLTTVDDRRLTLKADVATIGRYRLEDEDGVDLGAVGFVDGGSSFTVEPHTQHLDPASRYYHLPPPLPGVHQQKWNEVWVAPQQPPNFPFSHRGCYHVNRMSPTSFQETGCDQGRYLFALPEDGSADYDVSGRYVIPFGWTYVSDIYTDGAFFSTMATSSSDISSSYSGGTGFGFSFAGVDFSHNDTVTKEAQAVTTDEKMRSYHYIVSRSHAMVLDPRKAKLDRCFVRTVLRAAGPGAKPPAYLGDLPDTGSTECPESLDDRLTPDKLVDLYGTHFAHAITFGAKLMKVNQYSASALQTLVAEGTSVDMGLKWEVSGNLQLGPVGLNGKASAGWNSQTNKDQATNLSRALKTDEGSWTCIGGATCSSTGDVSVGTDGVPIFLDLRPLSDLLASPLFEDPLIIHGLRDAVAAVLKGPDFTAAPLNPSLVDFYEVGLDLNTLGCNWTRSYNMHLPRPSIPTAMGDPTRWPVICTVLAPASTTARFFSTNDDASVVRRSGVDARLSEFIGGAPSMIAVERFSKGKPLTQFGVRLTSLATTIADADLAKPCRGTCWETYLMPPYPRSAWQEDRTSIRSMPSTKAPSSARSLRKSPRHPASTARRCASARSRRSTISG